MTAQLTSDALKLWIRECSWGKIALPRSGLAPERETAVKLLCSEDGAGYAAWAAKRGSRHISVTEVSPLGE